jgi:tetratricopeptide (TPR) repeat protein
MKRIVTTLVLVLIGAVLGMADFQDILDRADRLHESQEYAQTKGFIESSLSEANGGNEQAELYWRLARAWLNLGDEAEDRGATEEELLVFFERGEAEAHRAMVSDPGNHLGYYWKSANIGRWGQVKGILNSLARAKPMRDLLQQALVAEPEHADSYYVLGQLFEQLPGFPISFGDKNAAVSLGRKSVDLQEQQVGTGIKEEINYDFYTELAKHLWERDYSAARRRREQSRDRDKYQSISGPMEKNFYYEAVVSLKEISDREEALGMIDRVIGELEKIGDRTDSQNDDLMEARELLASWR